jgi:hypothetical protein
MMNNLYSTFILINPSKYFADSKAAGHKLIVLQGFTEQ